MEYHTSSSSLSSQFPDIGSFFLDSSVKHWNDIVECHTSSPSLSSE
ncbi:MAG: hypothetical protein ACR5LA_10305 [Wolbachia sp.]